MAESMQEIAAELQRALGALQAAPALAEHADPLGSVTQALALQQRVADLTTAAVQRARAQGVTWQRIADLLGVSRQAAFQRFGRPIDPRTGDPMDTTPLTGSEALAAEVVDDLVAGRFAAVNARFDGRMHEALGDEGLAAAWAHVVGMVGAYEHRGEPSPRRAAELTVVEVPLQFEAGEFTARIAFRDDRRIAGLFLLPAT